jgi:Uma2 family endonuclease
MATTLTSLEEYLHTSYEPDMEYVDGVLVERNVGTLLHSFLLTIVIGFLDQFRNTHAIRILPTCRLQMGTAVRYRVPDVIALRAPYTKGLVAVDVPVIVVEIKSPDDNFDEVIDKCLEYSALGIPYILVFDPDHRRMYRFASGSLTITKSVDVALPTGSFEIVADSLFAELDEESPV